jgi:YD repeat-containing protein
MTDGTGVTTYDYDNRERLQTKATPFGTLSYGYDAASNLTSTQSNNANGISVAYRYDALNRLDRVTDNRVASGITDYQFDEVGNLKQSNLPNGVQNVYDYNPTNDLLT